MRDRLAEFGGAEVVVVTFTRQRNLAGYRRRFVAPLTTLADEDRVTYRAYGLERASNWTVWGPRVLLRYVTLVRSGRKLEAKVDDDLRQLGGDFVIGPDGRLRLCRPQRGPDDRPATKDLIAAATSA